MRRQDRGVSDRLSMRLCERRGRGAGVFAPVHFEVCDVLHWSTEHVRIQVWPGHCHQQRRGISASGEGIHQTPHENPTTTRAQRGGDGTHVERARLRVIRQVVAGGDLLHQRAETRGHAVQESALQVVVQDSSVPASRQTGRLVARRGSSWWHGSAALRPAHGESAQVADREAQGECPGGRQEAYLVAYSASSSERRSNRLFSRIRMCITCSSICQVASAGSALLTSTHSSRALPTHAPSITVCACRSGLGILLG